MRIGSIYVYEYPGSGRDVYTGSTQDGDTMRRHGEHLEDKWALGRWLRWYLPDETPVPREVERVEYENISELHARENYWMDKLGTMRVHGGLNKVHAGGPDRSELGQIGGAAASQKNIQNKVGVCYRSPEKMSDDGKKGGAAAGAKHALYKTGVCGRSPEKMSEDGYKAGKRTQELYPNLASETICRTRIIHPDLSVKACQRAHELYPDLSARAGRRAHEIHPGLASKAGHIGNHNRWHVQRGIISIGCELCSASIKS